MTPDIQAAIERVRTSPCLSTQDRDVLLAHVEALTGQLATAQRRAEAAELRTSGVAFQNERETEYRDRLDKMQTQLTGLRAERDKAQRRLAASDREWFFKLEGADATCAEAVADSASLKAQLAASRARAERVEAAARAVVAGCPNAFSLSDNLVEILARYSSGTRIYIGTQQWLALRAALAPAPAPQVGALYVVPGSRRCKNCDASLPDGGDPWGHFDPTKQSFACVAPAPAGAQEQAGGAAHAHEADAQTTPVVAPPALLAAVEELPACAESEAALAAAREGMKTGMRIIDAKLEAHRRGRVWPDFDPAKHTVSAAFVAAAEELCRHGAAWPQILDSLRGDGYEGLAARLAALYAASKHTATASPSAGAHASPAAASSSPLHTENRAGAASAERIASGSDATVAAPAHAEELPACKLCGSYAFRRLDGQVTCSNNDTPIGAPCRLLGFSFSAADWLKLCAPAPSPAGEAGERAIVQLAGCLIASEGGHHTCPAKRHSYGWSPAYEQTCRLWDRCMAAEAKSAAAFVAAAEELCDMIDELGLPYGINRRFVCALEALYAAHAAAKETR